MKVTAKIEVTVPANFLVYDLADETLYCHGCGKSESYKTVSLTPEECLCGRKACPSAALHGSSAEYFKAFVGRHTQCVVERVEAERKKAIREEASQPCRQDYRDANGRGPHECGKVQNHGGSCGP